MSICATGWVHPKLRMTWVFPVRSFRQMGKVNTQAPVPDSQWGSLLIGSLVSCPLNTQYVPGMVTGSGHRQEREAERPPPPPKCAAVPGPGFASELPRGAVSNIGCLTPSV